MERRFLERNKYHQKLKKFSKYAFSNDISSRDNGWNMSYLIQGERMKMREIKEKREKQYTDAAEVLNQTEQDLRQHQAIRDGTDAISKYKKINRTINIEARKFLETQLSKADVMETFKPDNKCTANPESDEAYKTSKIYKSTGLNPDIIRKVVYNEVSDLDDAARKELQEALHELNKDNVLHGRIKLKVQQLINSDPSKAKFRHEMEDRLYWDCMGKRLSEINQELRDGRDERDKEQKLAEQKQLIAKLKEQNKLLKNNRDQIDLDKAKRDVIETEAKLEAEHKLAEKVEAFDQKLAEIRSNHGIQLKKIEQDKLADLEKVRAEHKKNLQLIQQDNDILLRSLNEANKKRLDEFVTSDIELSNSDSDGEEAFGKEQQRLLQHKKYLRKKKEAEKEKAKMDQLVEKLEYEKGSNNRRRKYKKTKRSPSGYSYVTARKSGANDENAFSTSDDDYFSCGDSLNNDVSDHFSSDSLNNDVSDNKKMDQFWKNEISNKYRENDGRHKEGYTNGYYCCNENLINHFISCFNMFKCCGHHKKQPTHIEDKPFYKLNQPPNIREGNAHYQPLNIREGNAKLFTNQ